MITSEELTKLITLTLPDAEVFARDLTGNADHYEAFVVSELFEGKSRLERSRIVMAALAEPLKGPLHAFTLKTFTKTEWETAQNS